MKRSWHALLVNIGWRKPDDGNYVRLLPPGSWQAVVALALAVVIATVLHHLWR